MHFELGREPMTALRYYAEAAEAALAHLSPRECMSLTEHALTLLDQAPEGTERDALEIALATLRGRIGDPRAWRQSSRSEERVPACVLASRRHPRTSDARTAAARVRVRSLSAGGLCRGAGGGGTSRGALVCTERSGACARHVHRARIRGSASGPTARGWHMDRARARVGGASRRWRRPKSSSPIRRSRCWGCSACTFFSSGFVEQGRARLEQAHARARLLGWPNHAAGGILVRRAVRGATRQRGACRGSGRRNARARRRIRGRARSNRVPVVSRLGGRPDGPTARWLSPHPRGVRRQYAARDAGGRKRGPGVCRGGPGACRRLGWRATRTRGRAASREHARGARVSAAAVRDARLPSRARVATARPPTPRFDARSRRPERRRRRGWS